jgi:hypothetical protein
MKVLTIIVAIMTFALVAGAAFRLASMTPETEPLFDMGFAHSEAEELDPDQAASRAKQERIARHLRGDSWEKVGEPPASGTEADDFQRGEEVLENREEDLDEAKKKMRSVF